MKMTIPNWTLPRIPIASNNPFSYHTKLGLGLMVLHNVLPHEGNFSLPSKSLDLNPFTRTANNNRIPSTRTLLHFKSGCNFDFYFLKCKDFNFLGRLFSQISTRQVTLQVFSCILNTWVEKVAEAADVDKSFQNSNVTSTWLACSSLINQVLLYTIIKMKINELSRL